MTIPAPAPSAPDPVRWLNNQPYLLLSLTSLFWAGNIVLARYVAGHVPPMTLSCVRWIGAFLMLMPFAWPHLRRDWPALRARLPLMVALSATGFAFNNAISYWALQYTEALNALLIQSSGPLFVALWALTLFGVRLTWAQLAGIMISLAGVLTILLRGDFAALVSIRFNRGDVMFAGAVVSFGLYSALMTRRPKTHQLSLISFTIGCGALLLLPFSIWEFSTGVRLKPDLLTAATLSYVVIFPSTLAYLFFNRGIALIGPNRAAPFLHLVPVFGSAMAILLLGEQPQLFHLIGYVLVLAGVVIASRQASAAA
ncbi:DMT family transporter [Bradyrhizobium sediminis]|uniref:DMT family transporter n=1 Tax=Bradyrhizobium sediminis TaxID=2840469 RepID=A0A975NW97_9BRAD|nr:DMT family transporter [Bradyrhizobium sediminis]QWG22548.1 DMT family transporter [Bradyrhizobium sediminis]